LILIVQISQNMMTLEVIGTLFCLGSNDGTKVMCWHFNLYGKACPF
jgi:hypothetical protein